MADGATSKKPERHLKLAYDTETVKRISPSQIPELEILAVLHRMELRNEYIAKRVEEHAERLEKFERNNTSTTVVNTSMVFPSGMATKYLFPTNQPYVITDWPVAFVSQETGDPVPASEAVDSSRDVKVPLHLLLEMGSLAVAVAAAGSIVSWLWGAVPLLNPFASLLALIASPFFFGMGRIARANRGKQKP